MGKKATRRKSKKGRPNEQPAREKSRKAIRPSRVFIYALALAALSGGGYLVFDRIRRKKAQMMMEDDQDIKIISNNLPYTQVSSKSGSSGSTVSGNFPLKRGSRGSRVTTLQQTLARIIGTSAMNANGGIDGQFGPGTANALKMAGYPEIIDEKTFNKITGMSSSALTVIFNPAEIALQLYRTAQSKNLDSVLSNLKQIKSVPEYSSVNEYYKKQGFISKTIVTDLLDFAFKANDAAKQEIRSEFLRMGLKADDSGRWSLQGIPLYKDLITLRETLVIDTQNNRIPVRRNTILGDEVRIENGMTWFRSIDNSILKVPTQDVKYT